jgi:hypothetical protein
MNRYLEEAKAIRASIDGLADGQSDEKLADNKAAFPWWNGDGVYYLTGMLLRHGDNLYRVKQPHRSQNDWSPDKVSALFDIVQSGDGYPQWEPGTYAKGTKRSNLGKRWISNIDGNIWEPGATGVYTWDEVVW